MEISLTSKADLYSSLYTSIKSFCVFSKFVELPPSISEYFIADSIETDSLKQELGEVIYNEILSIVSDWGAIFPKLNNISPKDAEFIIPNMRCISVEDIFILLKSSSRVSNEVANSSEKNNKIILTIKKWYSIDPSTEFRIFISNWKLVAVSQRYREFVYPREDLAEIRGLITNFMKKFTLKAQSSLSKDCLDLISTIFVDIVVYINSAKVKIFDVQQLGTDTPEDELILFSHSELQKIKGVELQQDYSEGTSGIEEDFHIRVVDELGSKGFTKGELEILENKYPLELKDFPNFSIDELIKQANEQNNK